MSESLPPACADCQKLLAIGPDSFDQPGVRDHLADCATCSHLYAQYCKIDTLLNHVPDLKPLPGLAQRFQQIPQARHIADLNGSIAAWEGIVEEKRAPYLSRSWLDEPATHSFSQNQGKQTVQKPSLTPDTGSSHPLCPGQFQQPVNPAPRPRRLPWGAIASAAVLLVVLATSFAWLLRPTQPGATASHGGATPTTVPAPPTSSSTEQYGFTAQDSGKTVTYPITARFVLTLNQQQYPQTELRVDCNPQEAASATAGMVYAPPGFYAIQYQTIEAGNCQITDRGFTLSVIITGVVTAPTGVPTPTTPAPMPGLTQQYAFTASDSGRTVRFSITARFTLTFNQQTYPQAHLQLACDPQGTVSATAGMVYAPPGFYAVQYQANEAGSCKILDGSFTLAVIVEA